jgi:hypothetical protein
VVKRKSQGQKNRDHFTKIAIIKYLADKDAEGSVRQYLKNNYNIREARGVRKHIFDLRYKLGFLDVDIKLKKDFETYRKILDYLTNHKNSFYWDISDFTHKTKYGIEHLNDKLIDWWADKMYDKFCNEYNTPKSKINTEKKLEFLVTGINLEQLLRMVKMSPHLFTYMMHVDDIKFHSSNMVRDDMIRSALYDIATQNPLVDSVLFNSHVGLPKHTRMKKYHGGIELELKYQIFPKMENEIANS